MKHSDINEEENQPVSFWEVVLWVALLPILTTIEILITIIEAAKMLWRSRK